ncbi:MAG: trehalose-6-phosphate synthase [Chrysiogenetes bacterium]|nr:trehalose-6-phosphate synthase [Chrysiogenetes bacterium]
MSESRLIIAANRLPVTFVEENGRLQAKPSGGGLVTALRAVLRNRGGLWVGWSGSNASLEGREEDLAQANREAGFELHPIELSEREVNRFYLGFSNQIAWPLFHSLIDRCKFSPEYWDTYMRVNERFARRLREHYREGDYIWVHDYHLMEVGRELRRLGLKAPIGFFLHIPFPPVEVFLRLPWREKVMQALLDFDLLGFQTMRDRRHFLNCVRQLVPGVEVQAKGALARARLGERELHVGAFPISIDFREFADAAASDHVTQLCEQLREQMGPRKVMVGLDRLDYTKGIPHRFRAFENALERYPDLQGHISLVQIVAPSRETIPEYESLHAEIERLVGRINGRFSRVGWIPIHYLYRTLTREEILAYCRSADIGLVTPLCDGMNLVAKEYCACNLDESGVLILSEFAGAASELQRDALLVNPFDIEGTADAIYQAAIMPPERRHPRMQRLRQKIRRNDIQRWVDSFLRIGMGRALGDFPVLESIDDYVPRIHYSGGAENA